MSTTNGKKQKTADVAARDALKRTGKKKRTYEAIIVDESWSMMGLQEAVVSGVNEFVDAFKDTKGVRFVVAWFDKTPGEPMVRYKIDNVKAREVKALTAADYMPRGATPLHDTILTVIDRLDKMADKDDGVDVTIITDGIENASEVKDPNIVAAVIDKYTERGWAFTYIGANQHSEYVAAKMGMRRRGQAFNFDATSGGVRATMRSASNMSKTYTNEGYEGRMASASALYAATGGKLGDDDEQTSSE